MRHLLPGILGLCLACGTRGPESETAEVQVPEFEPPVAINAEPPVRYPPQLYREGVEGTVVMLLFLDQAGQVILDSTRVQEGSGYPALDSAVLAGIDGMEFAPARRNGQPVSTWFLQPVHFRHPERSRAGGSL